MSRKFLLVFIFNSFFIYSTHAQVFKTIGKSIGDFNTVEKADSFALEVKGLPKQIDQKFGLAKVCINLTHERVSDLKVELLSPDGTKIWLTNRNGGVDGKSRRYF